MNLTTAQCQILAHAKKNKIIYLYEIKRYYSTEQAGRNALDRLIMLGFLESDPEMLGRFKWTGQEIDDEN